MKIELMPLAQVLPYARNPRINAHAIDKVAASIKEFGFRQPIVVDAENVIVVGHVRYEAAKRLKDTMLDSTSIQLSGDGEKPVAVITLTFAVLYCTKENAPETLV